MSRSPLSDRSTRLRLLAWSYLDAVDQGGRGAEESISTSSASSKAPVRNFALWHQGSYSQLEKALSKVPPYVRLRFWVFYIRATGPFDHKHKPHAVLQRVLDAMPQDIFVPHEISEAAGFLESEADRFSRR